MVLSKKTVSEMTDDEYYSKHPHASGLPTLRETYNTSVKAIISNFINPIKPDKQKQKENEEYFIQHPPVTSAETTMRFFSPPTIKIEESMVVYTSPRGYKK